MKNLITKLIWKIQLLATTKIFELFLWITISGSVSALLLDYLSYTQHMNNIIIEVIFIIFCYYAGYKIILE